MIYTKLKLKTVLPADAKGQMLFTCFYCARLGSQNVCKIENKATSFVSLI